MNTKKGSRMKNKGYFSDMLTYNNSTTATKAAKGEITKTNVAAHRTVLTQYISPDA